MWNYLNYWLCKATKSLKSFGFPPSGDVYIHPTANIDPSAVVSTWITAYITIYFYSVLNLFLFLQLGPNVSIGKGVTIGGGVRVRESIILHGAVLQVTVTAHIYNNGNQKWKGNDWMIKYLILCFRTTVVCWAVLLGGTVQWGSGQELKERQVTQIPTILMPRLTARLCSGMEV